MTVQTRQADQLVQVVPAPIVLAPGSWEARLVLYLRRLHAAGKPSILVLKLGDQPVNWFRCIPDGRE